MAGRVAELRDFAQLAGMARTPAADGQVRHPNVLALANRVLARFFGPNCREKLAAKLAARFDRAGLENPRKTATNSWRKRRWPKAGGQFDVA